MRLHTHRQATALAVTAWVLALTLVLSGCATTAPGGTTATAGSGAAAAAAVAAPANPDPWENFNRKVYAFNDAVDKAVVRPVAQTYRDVVPKLVRTGIDNVLGNIYDVWSTANHMLQGKVQTGLEMGMRVLSNTVFGLGGLLDPASEMGLERRSEDFGQTLGRWGVPAGPYVVLPLLGPSTVRDTAGFLVDRQVAPSTLPATSGGQYALMGVEFVNVRANLLSTGDLVDQVALDRYAFIRDGFLSRRRDAVFDGKPPTNAFIYDTDDSNEPPAGVAPAASAPARAPARPTAAPRASGLPASASASTSAPTPAMATRPAAAPAAASAAASSPTR